MLFHGEQAISQFSEALPAAVYQLPWRSKNGEVIRYEEKLSGFKRLKDFPFADKLSIGDAG